MNLYSILVNASAYVQFLFIWPILLKLHQLRMVPKRQQPLATAATAKCPFLSSVKTNSGVKEMKQQRWIMLRATTSKMHASSP